MSNVKLKRGVTVDFGLRKRRCSDTTLNLPKLKLCAAVFVHFSNIHLELELIHYHIRDMMSSGTYS